MTEKKPILQNNEIVKEAKPVLKNTSAATAINFLDQNADTTSLQQIYSESTLNVTIKYPVGWTFIDQNLDKKLDGVTFWSNVLQF